MSASSERESHFGLWCWASIVLLFLAAPILIIVIVSFGNSLFMEFPPRALSLRWYRNFFTSSEWLGAALLSLEIALPVALCATVLGTSAAIGIVRARFWGRRAFELFIVSPMIVPTIALAIGLYLILAPLGIVGTPLAIFLGHTVIATAPVVIMVSAALRTVSPTMELAARSLGASVTAAQRHVTLPLIAPAIFGGAAFAFLTSFDEAVTAIFLGGPEATTLPKRMWEGVRFEIDPTLTAVSSLLVLAAALVLLSVIAVQSTWNTRR